MGRRYDNSGFASIKHIAFGASGSLAGTAAIAVKGACRFKSPVSVLTGDVYFVAGGTSTAQSFVLGKSLAGTGAFSAIGTCVVGTQATDSSKSFTLTATSFTTDDVLVLKAGGTAATVPNGIVSVSYREEFVNG